MDSHKSYSDMRPDLGTCQQNVSEHYDPDLWAALNAGGELGLRKSMERDCTCGHRRADHFAATGALGSMGGSACELCWDCATFTEATAICR